jgi:hypothetical protein
MRTTLRAMLWFLVAAAAASAQNNELGLLIGPSLFRSQAVPGTSTYVTFTGQANYAVQLHEESSSRFYLEFPLLMNGAVIQYPLGSSTATQVGGRLFFTPGIRWKWMAASRWSLYAAGGAGIRKGSLLRATMDLGIGGDCRLTRIFSLRGEVRTFFTPDLPAYVGLVHSSFLIGGVIHF